MTHEETIKRIQSLVPSLVQTASHIFKGNNLRCSNCGATSQQEYDGIECIEILGNPITLAVIIQAIKKTGYNSTEEWLSVLGKLVDNWNLAKDNFNDQSEETKTFIGGLLGN